MNKLKIISDLIILLIPKFIRIQYSDLYNKLVYLSQRIKDKITILKRQEYTLVPEVEDVKQDCKILFALKNRESFVSSPLLESEKGTKYEKSIQSKVPDIKVYSLEDIHLIGGTDALLYDEKFHHYELLKMENYHDLKAWDIFTKKEDKVNKNREITTVEKKLNTRNNYVISQNNDLILDDNMIYITLLKEHSINYYHWVTEALPRLIIVLNTIDKLELSLDNYTILIDENTPKQLIETIGVVANKNMKIKIVPRGYNVKCKKLLYCSPLWLSLDNTTSIPNPKKEFFVDAYALKIVKNKIESKINLSSNRKVDKKIYIKRSNSTLRQLTNLNKMEKMLKELDFDFVDIGSLSFEEQVILFSEIKIAVGISGAAFTNILFMSPQTHVVSLYPSAMSTNYYVFQPLADCSQVNLTHFLTTPKDINGSVHEKASVKVSRLKEKLESLIGDYENGKV